MKLEFRSLVLSSTFQVLSSYRKLVVTVCDSVGMECWHHHRKSHCLAFSPDGHHHDRLRNDPNRSTSQSLEPVSVTVASNRDFTDVIRVKILTWRDDLTLLCWAQCNHRSL